MTTWFVSRHPGAIQWAKIKNLPIDRWVEHFDASKIGPGDTIIGPLPMEDAAEVCRRGAIYKGLSFHVSQNQRGKELSAEDLVRLGCRLVRYDIKVVR